MKCLITQSLSLCFAREAAKRDVRGTYISAEHDGRSAGGCLWYSHVILVNMRGFQPLVCKANPRCLNCIQIFHVVGPA